MNGQTSAFVIGAPIAHSRSPVIHGHWLRAYDLSGMYQARLVEPDHLADFVGSLRDPDSPIIGGNVTMPHKERIIPLLDQMTETATRIGAVNTIFRHGDKLVGDNTDAYGFAANLNDRIDAWSSGERAIVIGAGGAARAILVALIDAGYREIALLNRTVARATELAAAIDPIRIVAAPIDAFAEELPRADLVVNTAALHVGDDPEAPAFNFSGARADCLVTDINYVPLETSFLKHAKDHDLETADGLGMLLHQAVPGFERWFGVRPVVDQGLRDAVLAS